MSLYVEIRTEIRVDLPEEKDWETDGKIPPEGRERAIEAVMSVLPQYTDLFLDGLDKDPTVVFIDVAEHDVEEVRWE